MKKRNRKAAKVNNLDTVDGSKIIGEPAGPIGRRPADKRLQIALSLVVLLLSGGLLFFNLGHYPFWADEADTAIFARGIARTGDTSGLIDQNLYAFRNGALLTNLHGRYQPPAPYYLAALFVGANRTGTFWPRFPFAVCGLLSVALMLYWMSRSRFPTAMWIVFSIGLLCNVTFFLYCRQCRYYSMAILLSLAIVYQYINWKGRLREFVWINLASILLLTTNYLSYAALYAVLACDYLIFKRRQMRLKFKEWIFLLGPQILAGIVIVWIYNPLAVEVAPGMPVGNIFLDKLTLMWWNFRDLNSCEFCVGIVMLAAPFVYIWTRNIWLLRGIIALICYIIVITIFSPQPLTKASQADVRYLTPLLPLCICMSALVIVSITRHRWFFALPLAVLVFGTNILNFPFSPNRWCSRPVEFAGELLYPRDTSIDMAVQWINANIHRGESIWVLPDDMESSFMYHAPQATYAWHLIYPPKEQFAALPPIHFLGRAFPDYFIIFGPNKKQAGQVINMLKSKGIEYNLIKVLDIYWDDLTRPEIFWRAFQAKEKFNRDNEAVYIYCRVKPHQLK